MKGQGAVIRLRWPVQCVCVSVCVVFELMRIRDESLHANYTKFTHVHDENSSVRMHTLSFKHAYVLSNTHTHTHCLSFVSGMV